jgi:hypothetical protein
MDMFHGERAFAEIEDVPAGVRAIASIPISEGLQCGNSCGHIANHRHADSNVEDWLGKQVWYGRAADVFNPPGWRRARDHVFADASETLGSLGLDDSEPDQAALQSNGAHLCGIDTVLNDRKSRLDCIVRCTNALASARL